MHRSPDKIGWYHRGATIDDMLRSCIAETMEVSDPDAVLSIESHFLNTTLIADSCEMEFDVGKELTLNVARWSRLIKEYVDQQKMDVFINQCREIIAGDSRDGATTEFRFKDPIRSEKKHRWGGCLLAATFHGSFHTQPTLTFHSRTTYMGYIGMLDAAIAAVIARKITEEFEGESGPRYIRFIWHIGSMQLHHFKTIPYIFNNESLMKKLGKRYDREAFPVWWNTHKWFDRVLKDYKVDGLEMVECEKYGPFKRVKRRYLEHIKKLHKNLPKSLMVDSLDFSKAQ